MKNSRSCGDAPSLLDSLKYKYFHSFLSCHSLQRFLKEVVDQLELGQDPPPVIFINSRLVRVNGPEAISKALVDEVTSQDNLLNLSKFPDLLQGILEQVSMVAGVKTQVGDGSFNLATLAGLFKKDEENLTETIKKLNILFKSIASLPRKPVIVIGRVVGKFWILFSRLFDLLFP